MPTQIEEIAKHVATAKRQAKSEPRSEDFGERQRGNP